MKNAEGEDIVKQKGTSEIWNYYRDLPLPNSPVFHFPLRFRAVFKWFQRGWLSVSAITIWLALAVTIFKWLQPSLTQLSMQTVFGMMLRNLFFIIIVAGGLHVWL